MVIELVEDAVLPLSCFDLLDMVWWRQAKRLLVVLEPVELTLRHLYFRLPVVWLRKDIHCLRKVVPCTMRSESALVQVTSLKVRDGLGFDRLVELLLWSIAASSCLTLALYGAPCMAYCKLVNVEVAALCSLSHRLCVVALSQIEVELTYSS